MLRRTRFPGCRARALGVGRLRVPCLRLDMVLAPVPELTEWAQRFHEWTNERADAWLINSTFLFEARLRRHRTSGNLMTSKFPSANVLSHETSVPTPEHTGSRI